MLPLSQRPLLATAADTALFVDRDRVLDSLRRSVRHGFNTLLLGERGSGKTSLLHQLQRDLLDKQDALSFVEAGSAESVRDLVDLVDAVVNDRHPDPMVRAFSHLAKGGDPFLAEDVTANDVRRLAPADGGHQLVVLDSVTDPLLIQRLFGRLRDDLWQLPVTWVVAGQAPERSRYLEAPADAFFDVVLEIDELEEEAAAELLYRRADADRPTDESAAETLRVLGATIASQVRPRTPRNLLAAARDALVKQTNAPEQWLTNWNALQTQAAALGRPAATLFIELVDLAPVSASDKRLLDRLGWSRARATQVLHELESAGLVVATEAAPAGPGRPRKLYAPNDHYHAVEDR